MRIVGRKEEVVRAKDKIMAVLDSKVRYPNYMVFFFSIMSTKVIWIISG